MNSRDKGKRGEREIVKLLDEVLERVYGEGKPLIQRNTLQSHQGGYDIIGIDWLAIEVKFQEKDFDKKWWEQCVRQAGESQQPTLFFRRTRQPWKVMIQITLHKPVPVVMNIEDWLEYFEWSLECQKETKI